MPRSRTITGKDFEYSGSLDAGLTVTFRNATLRISREIIRVIRDEITRRSPVLMGACYKPLVPDSVGETLSMEHGTTPQVMSYVLPLLIDEGFCRASNHKPFKICLNRRG